MSDAVMPSSPPESEPDAGVTERVTSYRRVREQVERSILPLATSVDGYAFGFQASLHDLKLSGAAMSSSRPATGEGLGRSRMWRRPPRRRTVRTERQAVAS